MAKSNDPVLYAVNIGKKVLYAVNICNQNQQIKADKDNRNNQGKGNNNEEKYGIVKRAVDFPSLMLSVGLNAAYTFYLSKISLSSDIDKIVYLFKYFDDNTQNNNMDKNICEEFSKKEGAGYLSYISLLLKMLKDMQLININFVNKKDETKEKNDTENENYKNILLDIVEKLNLRTQRQLLPYVLEIKNVLEAI